MDGARPVEKPRIPVPAPTAVLAQTKVLAQALGRRRPRPVRQIFGDGVGGFIDRGEAFLRAGAHEALDFHRPGRIETRRHVHEHERRKARRKSLLRGLPFGEHRRHAAQRSADHGGFRDPLFDRGRDRRGIGGEIGGVIGAFFAPVGIAVPALIERDRRKTRGREPAGGFREGVPRLPAAMQQKRRPRAIAINVADQADCRPRPRNSSVVGPRSGIRDAAAGNRARPL